MISNSIFFVRLHSLDYDSGIHSKHADRIGVPIHVCSDGDKLALIDKWRQELDLEWTQVAYMGRSFCGDVLAQTSTLNGPPETLYIVRLDYISDMCSPIQVSVAPIECACFAVVLSTRSVVQLCISEVFLIS